MTDRLLCIGKPERGVLAVSCHEMQLDTKKLLFLRAVRTFLFPFVPTISSVSLYPLVCHLVNRIK